MARFVDFTTNFSTGELDPLLRARVDLQQYGNALAKATNVLIQPQGGLRRRPGLKHILQLPLPRLTVCSSKALSNGTAQISCLLLRCHVEWFVTRGRTGFYPGVIRLATSMPLQQPLWLFMWRCNTSRPRSEFFRHAELLYIM